MGFRHSRMHGTGMNGSVIKRREPTAMNWTPEDDKTRDEVMEHEDLFSNGDEEDGMSGWGYGYTDDGTGKGKENSPEIFESKKDALKWAKKAKYYDVSK